MEQETPIQETLPALEECARISATVSAVEEDLVKVDLSGGRSGRLKRAELSELPEPGSEIEVWVDRLLDDGTYAVSKNVADRLRLWDRLVEAVTSGEEIEGMVMAPTKGGLTVDVGTRAFLPASQADLRGGGNLDGLVGQTLSFNVLEFNAKRGRPVLTRKPILEKARAAQREETLKTLAEGDIVSGTVMRFTDFGVFVDIGGFDGLLHVNDLSWGRVKSAKEVLESGQEIRVKVLKIERDKKRISLGYKQLTEDPWSKADERHEVGSKIRGKVVSTVEYGAFVEIEPGLEGMVHVSEMSWTRRVKNPTEVVKVGQKVEVVLTEIDPEQRRISLSIKQAQSNPWVAFAEKYPPDTKVQGEVRSVTDFGIFVNLEEGLDGLVHATDMSWTEKVHDPGSRYKKGDTVEAVVLSIDPDSQRLSLGVKQLAENPWKDFAARYPTGKKIKVEVTRVADFGAFMKIEEGIEGLCHISQLSVDRVAKTTDIVKPGDTVEVAVIGVDKKERRVSLSIKALSEDTGDYKSYMAESGSGFAPKLGDLFNKNDDEG